MENRIRRALVSVFDKEGVVEFCRTLAAQEIEILSSGGTARLLRESGIDVVAVSDYTGFPEMLDGRVKTLHPRIHAGILAVRSNAEHIADIERNDIATIDLVVVNLYPFEKTASTGGISRDEVVEMIDIGGPAMVRAAAKNFADVGIVVRPADYDRVADELRTGGSLSHETRLDLAIQAFRHTSAYDSAVYSYLAGLASDSEDPDGEASPFGERLSIEYTKVQDLRYGENPHQRAAFYRDPLCTGPSICGATQLQGKELSFNNILDLDAALSLAADIATCACTVIKHGNPCGAAIGGDPQEAFKRALECDPMSAFGGVIAFNRRVNRHAAESVAETFFEAVVAPFFDDEARHVLSRKKKLRLLECGELNRFSRSGYDLRRVNGGLLAQDWDNLTESVRESRVVTARQPTDKEWRGLEFAWTVGKHVKSNAIVFTSHDRTLGVGAGQMSRVDSARIAVEKARGSLQGSVMASDAFFPFRDGLDVAAEAGIVAVVQPGGSVRDDEVIASANEHAMTMIFTSRRHFRH